MMPCDCDLQRIWLGDYMNICEMVLSGARGVHGQPNWLGMHRVTESD